MFIDIAIPSGNEEKFIEQAKKLDTKGLIFLYEKPSKKDLEKIKRLNSKDFKVETGFVPKAKVSKNGCKYIFSKGSRSHFENGNVNVMFNLEHQHKRDKHHYKKSGLNQVLCKLAKTKKITVAFSFNSVLSSDDKGFFLGRMMANMNMCQKYKNKILIASFATNPKDLRFWKDLVSFGIVLGLNPKDAKAAVLNRKV